MSKRASPGDEAVKPLMNVELSDDDALKLQVVQKEIARVEILLERRAHETLVSVHEKRRAVAKAIPKFWPVALLNHGLFSVYAQHNSDRQALTYLEDLWIVRNPQETRAFTLEFYFKENPYFSDAVLKKEFKFVPPPSAADDKPDENGITESMVDFSWERDIVPSAIKINWKDPAAALTKLHPRVADEEDDLPSETGSFFNFFEEEADPLDLGMLIANEIFSDAAEYFLGTMGGEDFDSDDDDSDDEEAEEIDLEKPQSKKQRKA
ncbi:hypothetical protein FIBSPDRAFT_916479 [Athelia psychrophila]|uniref:Nucleosome assembly protein n=1 Tax=Athelia psychrophila TaxID=1759441 RepID=A0A166V1L3_9AGAM|nr:hypothetical protein FIBSPDRAFT_916479 [Fibularhizoctonia sp. CBS 109695]